jgi:hypothetical protein
MILWRPQHEMEERTKIIRADFARRYNLDELREQLFREQEAVCAICRETLQDSCSVVMAVDHATPVYLYATWDFTVEEACQHANAKCNLLAVHVACNSLKRHGDYEELMEQIQRGEVFLTAPKIFNTEEIQRTKERHSENSRKGIRALHAKLGPERMAAIGRKLALHTYARLGPEGRAALARKAGRVSGLKHAESGHLDRIRELPQSKAAHRESLNRIRELPQTKAAQRENGRRNAKSGRLDSIRTLDSCTKGGHTTNHVVRSRPNPRCEFCSEQGLVVAYA